MASCVSGLQLRVRSQGNARCTMFNLDDPSRKADKARDRRTGELVALKRLRLARERDGVC